MKNNAKERFSALYGLNTYFKKTFSYLLITLGIIITVYSCWYQVYWLAVGLAGIPIMLLTSKVLKNKYLGGVMYLVFPIVLALVIKTFVLEICLVPTPSMENTLLVGDRVIVSKLSLGPRMPRSIVEVPWVHALYLYFGGSRAYLEKKKEAHHKEYHRLKGFEEMRHGDVIVFNSSHENDRLLIKRVAALPGDTLEIRDGQVLINGKWLEAPKTGKQAYLLWPNKIENAKKWLDSTRIIFFDAYPKSEVDCFEARLSPVDLAIIEKSSLFDSISMTREKRLPRKSVWPTSTAWTYSNLGPLVIPSKNLEINDTSNHLEKIYHHIINTEEVDSLNTTPKKMRFKYNYYFVLGDNRTGSIDSRIFGLVKEEDIVGKGTMILFSGNSSTSCFSRSFKTIF